MIPTFSKKNTEARIYVLFCFVLGCNFIFFVFLFIFLFFCFLFFDKEQELYEKAEEERIALEISNKNKERQAKYLERQKEKKLRQELAKQEMQEMTDLKKNENNTFYRLLKPLGVIYF